MSATPCASIEPLARGRAPPWSGPAPGHRLWRQSRSPRSALAGAPSRRRDRPGWPAARPAAPCPARAAARRVPARARATARPGRRERAERHIAAPRRDGRPTRRGRPRPSPRRGRCSCPAPPGRWPRTAASPRGSPSGCSPAITFLPSRSRTIICTVASPGSTRDASPASTQPAARRVVGIGGEVAGDPQRRSRSPASAPRSPTPAAPPSRDPRRCARRRFRGPVP